MTIPKPVKLKLTLDQEDFGTLCICALRYCMGRQTYMPSLVREIVRSVLSKFSDKDIRVMLDDCEFQESCDLFGDPKIDKPGWLAWREELQAEKQRRETRAEKDP